MPKYSIVLPTYNSASYLQSAIDNVLSVMKGHDAEFVISNNCSTDETEVILSKLYDKRIKVIHPEKSLPLGAHWNFALEHATGQWVWAMGTDDGIMPYFFELCDILTDYCDLYNINVIKSNRAYYFWPGCEANYADHHIQYGAKSTFEVRSTHQCMHDMLTGKIEYIDLPQMYVSSLFSRALLEKAKDASKTNEIIPCDVPAQDAYLSVIACTFEEKYLYTDVPIGWVGTSPVTQEKRYYEGKLDYKECGTATKYLDVGSLLFNMLLTFNQYYENTKQPNECFNAELSPSQLYGRIYMELQARKAERVRFDNFYKYAAAQGVTKEQVIQYAQSIERQDAREKAHKQAKKSKTAWLLLWPARKAANLLRRIQHTKKADKDKRFYFELCNKHFFTYTEANKFVSACSNIVSVIKAVQHKAQ